MYKRVRGQSKMRQPGDIQMRMEVTNDHNRWHWQKPGAAWKGVGIYHVTLTVHSREPLLGKLVIPACDPSQAKVLLTEFGLKIKACVESIPEHHPEVRIIQLRMMPDHLHVILYVTRMMPVGIKSVVRGLWQGAKHVAREHTTSIDSNTIRDNQRYPSVFTEMPFIRPMSRKGQLQTMIRYVQMNPQRLATKRLMPGFFRVQEGIELAGRRFSGVGNTTLLLNEKFASVHVRRIWVQNAEIHGDNRMLRDYMNSCVLAARQGTVMVSPFISRHEKMVQEVLLKEGLPFILLTDNGFRDYYKPADSLFDAVAAGRVLILSPWEYDAEKKHISRADCVALNAMAEEIAQA